LPKTQHKADDVTANLASLLFGAYRREALALLLLHPETSLHVREIGRVTGKAPGTLLRELNQLANAGVLNRRPVGNQVQFQANSACPIFEDLRNILKKTAGNQNDFGQPGSHRQRGKAKPVLHSPEVSYVQKSAAKGPKPAAKKPRISRIKLKALCRRYGIAKLSLFGSASRGELTPESDVDLMVEFLPDSRASAFDMTAMQDEFSAALGGRKVDIATPEILRNPFRRDTIVPDLKTIYEA
jgi:predicted nucleotidyltransferase